MGFFGIGSGEILIILIIALVVVGPKKLPEIAKVIGRAFYEFKKTADEMSASFKAEMHRAEEQERVSKVKSQAAKNEQDNKNRIQPFPPIEINPSENIPSSELEKSIEETEHEKEKNQLRG